MHCSYSSCMRRHMSTFSKSPEKKYITYIYIQNSKVHKAMFFLQVAFIGGSSVTFSFVNDKRIYVVSYEYVIFYSTQKCTGLPGYMGWRAGTTTLCRS